MTTLHDSDTSSQSPLEKLNKAPFFADNDLQLIKVRNSRNGKGRFWELDFADGHSVFVPSTEILCDPRKLRFLLIDEFCKLIVLPKLAPIWEIHFVSLMMDAAKEQAARFGIDAYIEELLEDTGLRGQVASGPEAARYFAEHRFGTTALNESLYCVLENDTRLYLHREIFQALYLEQKNEHLSNQDFVAYVKRNGWLPTKVPCSYSAKYPRGDKLIGKSTRMWFKAK